jgi:hypothetical protein
MTKIILGKTPESFKPFAVKFLMPDGAEGSILAEFEYRTRTQFGQFLNGIFSDAGEAQKPDAKPDFELIFSKTRDKNADHLLACLKGWDLDQEVSLQSLRDLSDQIPAAAVALMSAYNGACTEGRLGN